jgi:hypothetical protein
MLIENIAFIVVLEEQVLVEGFCFLVISAVPVDHRLEPFIFVDVLADAEVALWKDAAFVLVVVREYNFIVFCF